MKSNLEVSHLLEKEKGRVLYMGSLSKIYETLSYKTVSREEEQN